MTFMIPITIITPKGTVYEGETGSVTAPGADGEMTVLPRHANLFTLLTEGVVIVRDERDEKMFSVGGGYLETDGKSISLLVSRAFGQDELDETEIKRAQAEAERQVREAPSEEERKRALSALRHTIMDQKLLQKVKRRRKH